MSSITATIDNNVWMKSTYGEASWEFDSRYESILFPNRQFDLGQLIASGSATTVKHGPGRKIYHVRLDGIELYVKHFRADSLVHLLQQQIRFDRARKECVAAQRLAKLGIPTVVPIALGQRRSSGWLFESFMVTLAIPHAQTLFELIEQSRSPSGEAIAPSVRRSLADQLASITATLHNAGIEHRDLHERNLIVQHAPGDAFPTLYLLDLHELRYHHRLPISLAKRELTRLGRYFSLRSSKLDRARFFSRYNRERQWGSASQVLAAGTIEQATLVSRGEFWRRRDRRSLAKMSQVKQHQQGSVLAYASTEVPADIVDSVLKSPTSLLETGSSRWMKIGRFTRVAEVTVDWHGQPKRLVYKQHLFKGWHEWFFCLFRSNQAQRAWKIGNSLMLRELPTAKPLMLVHHRFLGLPYHSYILMDMINDSMHISKYVDARWSRTAMDSERANWRQFIRHTARLFRELHERQISHRDLKSSNVLVSPKMLERIALKRPVEYSHPFDAVTVPAADPQVEPIKKRRPTQRDESRVLGLEHSGLWIIDLDGAHTWNRVPDRHRFQNLARFCVSISRAPFISNTDRLRFLKTYLNEQPATRSEWKRFWKEIKPRARLKLDRFLRQGRNVT